MAAAKKRGGRTCAARRAKKTTTARRASPAKRKRAKGTRELIAPRGDKRFVRRPAGGQYKESDDVSRSLSADRRRKAKTKARHGQGDRGD